MTVAASLLLGFGLAAVAACAVYAAVLVVAIVRDVVVLARRAWVDVAADVRFMRRRRPATHQPPIHVRTIREDHPT